MSFPVAGFRPRRSRFCWAMNFPKLLIRPSSPDSRDRLINSRIVSTVSKAFLGVPVGFYDGLDDSGFCEGAGFLHNGASFHERNFMLMVRG